MSSTVLVTGIGGFIAKHYSQPWDIELSVQQQRVIYRSFMENGCALALE